MITTAEVAAAESFARKQRLSAAKLLVVDESNASAEDLQLAIRVRLAGQADGIAYEKALADSAVNSLFARGVLRFGKPA